MREDLRLPSSSAKLQPLDRRVQLLDGVAGGQEKRLSELRAHPYIVLLGEPGSGKSSALELEAARAGSSVVTVRGLMNEDSASADTLFLDALDEYRVDGQDADKIQRLSKAISIAHVSQWRLTCRSEDWRKGADLLALHRSAPGESIIVAKLLPLDEGEAAMLLEAFGEACPEQFISKANALGVGALLRSPLSLKLLHRVVSRENAWPRSRYDLFDAAVTSLSHEHNDEYKRGERTAPHELVAAAEETCLLFLVCGARTIWRSNGEPPRTAGADSRAYLSAHDLNSPYRTVADMLDTPLFSGEGEEFEPLHRSVAEYLAGRALANIVTGQASRAAFPFARAVALITGVDGAAPAELRGLYAWFAAHLSRLGRSTEAIRLIESDAASVLFYGDAAALTADGRRALLRHLDREDPYFRAAESSDSVIGGLAQPDLALDFAQVLKGSPDDYESHRLSIVFDALKSGAPIPELCASLRDLALNPRRAEWDRARAIDAYLNYPDASPRELFDALEQEPPSLARAMLRLHIAARFATELTAEELRTLLVDFESTPNDNTVGRLIELTTALSTRAVDGFFDVPVKSWLPTAAGRWRHDVEIEDALDSVLVSSLRARPNSSASELWLWVNNLRGGVWSAPNEKVRTAVNEWLDARPCRESELFAIMLTHPETQGGPWQPRNAFVTLTNRYPSPRLTRSLIAQAADGSGTLDPTWLRAVAVEIASASDDAELCAETERALVQTGDATLAEHLRSSRAERERRLAEDGRKLKRDEDTCAARANNIRILTPLIDELRIGRHSGHLHWAAEVYFTRSGLGKEDDGNIARLRELTDDATFAAILEGWDYLATRELIGIDATQLATLDAQNRQPFVETAAYAGMHRRFKLGTPPPLHSTPLVNALVTIRGGARLRDRPMARQLFEWALDRLRLDPELGARELLTYWATSLDAGSDRVEPLWQLGESRTANAAAAIAIDRLLESRPEMPAVALQSAVRAALMHVGAARLREIAAKALGAVGPGSSPRRIWSFVVFALDPVAQRERFLVEHGADAETLFADDLRDGTVTAFRESECLTGEQAAEREAVLIRLLGAHVSLRDDPEGWYRSGPIQMVRSAINLLSSASAPTAGALLAQLAKEPALGAWRSSLRHARASWAAQRREMLFEHPAVADVQKALHGGPPLSSADLLAVVGQELENLSAELRSSENAPWKNYWNVGPSGRAETPVIENECRSRLLERLRDRCKPYGIVAAIPEAQRRSSTRSDMLVLSHAGRALPVEVKRHFHPDVWTAIHEQLLTYVSTHGSEGAGIYLVFWFGNDWQKPPPRHDGLVPDSADAFARMLRADLRDDMADIVHVFVFDVSRPTASIN